MRRYRPRRTRKGILGYHVIPRDTTIPSIPRDTMHIIHLPPTLPLTRRTRKDGRSSIYDACVAFDRTHPPGVQLTAEQGRVKVEAPPCALTEDLRQAMTEHKAALLQFAAFPFVETIDGLGLLTGNIQKRDLFLVSEERQEALRYRIGVVALRDGV